jgi:cell wall assembly regulator SMI1
MYFGRGGATIEEVQSFEQAIGQHLPEEVRQSYLVHNGSASFFGMVLLSLENSLHEWRTWQSLNTHDPGSIDYLESVFQKKSTSFPQETICLGYINPGWIPLCSDSGGNHFGIDLNPARIGEAGQVINFGRDEEDKYVLAWTWGWFLRDFATELECGNYQISDDGYVSLPGETHFLDAVEPWTRANVGGSCAWLTHDYQIDPIWLTRTVSALAQTIHENRTFDRLPIIGDALEDAGCYDMVILDHCRQPGDHGSGCWLIDAILAKKQASPQLGD